MKRKLFYGLAISFIAVLLFSSCAGVKMPEKYTVTPNPLEVKGDIVNVSVQGDIPASSFNKKAVVKFTPVLKYAGKEKELKTITLKGEKAKGEGQVIKFKNGATISYTDSFKYEEGMETSELFVEPQITKGKKSLPTEEIKLADGVVITSHNVSTDGKLYFADEETAKALGMDANDYYEKSTIVSKDFTVYFQVNLHKIDLKLPLNKKNGVQNQIKEMKEFIDLGWSVESINIKAYASPEGEERFNEGLSEKRSVSAKAIVSNIYKELYKDKKSNVKVKNPEAEYSYNVQALGEDWNGFMTAVEKSNIKDKNMILNVVKSQSKPIQKEQEIRNMTLIYEELKDEVLPPLRRAEIVFNFYEPKKTDAEILEYALTNPSYLLNKELLYAGTLTSNIDEQDKIYTAYANLFPNDWKGLVNAGAVKIIQGEYGAAKTYLEKANNLSPNNPMILNNLGVCYLNSNDFTKAKELFNQAAKVGANTAYNKGIINIYEGNYTEAGKNLENESCNYNKALYYVVNQDYDKAKQMLQCTPDTDAKYYLSAVLGARLDNKKMVIDNLSKAVQANSDMKAKAGKDVEFINYRTDSQFINIIK